MRKFIFLILTLMLTTSLISCGSEAPSSANNAPAATTAPTAVAASAEGTTATLQPRLLRIAVTNVPSPDPTLQSSYSDNQGLINIYDTLVFPNSKGEIDPYLATSWNSSPDGITWTFKLRQGVKFHNGDDLKASDVMFSFNRLMTFGSGHAYLYKGVVDSVSAPDDFTVQFKLVKPSATFLFSLIRLEVLDEKQVMTNIVTTGNYGDKGDYGRQYLTLHDAGSGPYTVEEMRPEVSLTVKRNSDWWGTFAANAPDEITFLPVTEPATQKSMYSTRDLEINDRWQTVENYQALAQIPGVKVASWDEAVGIYLMMDTKKPPTDDVHFRRALAYGFDYEAAQKIQPGLTPLIGPMASSVPGYDPTGIDFIHQRDLEKARAELALSKYAAQLDQNPVSIESASDAHDIRFSLLFQSNMADIGVKVNLVRPPWLTMYEDLRDFNKAPNLAYIQLSPEPLDVSAMLKYRYGSATIGTEAQNEWLQDPSFDAKVDQALSTVDPTAKKQLEHEMLQYLADICPTIFVAETPVRAAYQAAYVDWPTADGQSIPVPGDEMYGPVIQVYPEKRDALLK